MLSPSSVPAAASFHPTTIALTPSVHDAVHHHPTIIIVSTIIPCCCSAPPYHHCCPLHQVMLLFGTILGPGTIFLMLVGAFVAAFAGVGNWSAFQMNLYPIVLFMIVCFAAKSSRQVRGTEQQSL